MAWTTFASFITDQIVTPTDMNNIVGNLNYLFQRPKTKILFDNGANYTRAANTFADIDSTNLISTLTVTSGTVLVTFNAVATGSAAIVLDFDILVDGVRVGAGFTDGIYSQSVSNATPLHGGVSFSYLITGLSAGSHTFKPQWKAQTGTGTIYSGSGVAGTDYPVSFNVIEIG